MRYQSPPAAAGTVAILRHGNATEIPEVADVRQGDKAPPQAGSLSRKIIIASRVFAALIAGTTGALFRLWPLDSLFRSSHDNIADLQALPIGPVHLQGIVTYATHSASDSGSRMTRQRSRLSSRQPESRLGRLFGSRRARLMSTIPWPGSPALHSLILELQPSSSTAVCQRRRQ